MTAVRVFSVSLLAGLLLWAVETAHSILAGGLSAGGLRTHVPFAMLLLLLFSGWGVAAGLVQAACLSLVRFVGRRVERRRGPSPARLAAAALLAAICAPAVVLFSRRLFSGAGISRSPLAAYLRIGFPILGLAAVFVAAWIVATAAPAWFRPSRRAARAISAVAALLLLAALYAANARLYVGQYGFIHAAAGLLIFLLAEFFVLNLPVARKRGRAMYALLFAVCLVVAAVFAAARRRGGLAPGSRQLSLLHSRAHLGKQLLRLYGTRAAEEDVDEGAHLEYLARRDAFLADAARVDRKGCNLIWIMVDALRADHLQMHGYARDTAPHLAALAGRSLLFLRNYTQGPNTGTSLCAQMTGCYTSTLAARGRIDRVDTLPEMLRRKGYRTSAIAQKWDIDALGGKGREGAAFDTIVVEQEIPAEEINKKAIEILETRDPGKPFFLFAFYYEPHDPYRKHDGFDYGNRAVDLYDSEISYLDAQLGQLINYLEERGYFENTLLVVTADHGDELGQHGGWGHHWKMHDCLIHVPLILRVPGLGPAEVPTPVHSIDLAASLVELLGLEPNGTLDGTSFIPYLTKGEPPYVPRVFSEAEFQSSRKVCMIQYPWKLVYHASDGFFELIDLDADPGERFNRVDDAPDVLAVLRTGLLSWMRYRGRDASPAREVENASARTICERLARHDAGALSDLRALREEPLSANDFEAVGEAVAPYFSADAAFFLAAQARLNPAVRSRALEALRAVVRRADKALGGSDDVIGVTYGTALYAEAERIFADLSAGEHPRFLLSLASAGGADAPICVELLGMLRDASCADGLYLLRERESDPGMREGLFRALCLIGDPRVEQELIASMRATNDFHTLAPMIPMAANYRTERTRALLLDAAKQGGWWLAPLTSAIGRTRNDYMLPVLGAIIRAKPSPEGYSASVVSFSRKMAILTYLQIRGRENLNPGERKAIKESLRRDPHLAQYEDMRALRRELR